MQMQERDVDGLWEKDAEERIFSGGQPSGARQVAAATN